MLKPLLGHCNLANKHTYNDILIPQVVYNQHTLYAESGSYDEVESQPQTTSNEDDDISWVVLGPVVGVAASLVLATLVSIVIIRCYCAHSNRKKKANKSVSRDIIVVSV